jgi:transposase
MLRLPRSVRVFVSTRPVHCSTEADGLVRRVREDIGEDPYSGNLFCFFDRRRTRVKLFVWDRNGFWLFNKRLERGRFERLDSRAPGIEISREQLVMLLSGIDTNTSRFRRYFSREVRIASRASDGRSRATQ